MKSFSALLLALLALVLSGCIMAPLSTVSTARSNGKGNWMTHVGGSTTATAYLRQTYGLSDNFDIGVLGEVGLNNVLGVTAKYAFLNQAYGPAWAVLGGFGGGRMKGEITDTKTGKTVANDETDGYYGYIGPIYSYKFKYVEPYLLARLNFMHTREKIIPKANDDLSFEFQSRRGVYGTLAGGVTLWLGQHIGLTGNVFILVSHTTSDPFANVGVMLRY